VRRVNKNLRSIESFYCMLERGAQKNSINVPPKSERPSSALRCCKRKMAVWSWPGLLRQSNPGVPLDVMVCLRVLARTGRVGCRRPCSSFPPSSGSTAMSILCVARWRCARGMIECMCTQERLEPGSRHHIWRGGTLPPGYSRQQ
jgi:hypothetical protein